MWQLRTTFWLIFLTIVGNNLLQAQDKEVFHGKEGTLYLTDERVATGNMSYDLEREIVQIKVEGRLYSFQANQIQRFMVYGREEELRYFESLPVALDNGYVRNQLFELLYKGEASLYSREYEVGIGNQIFYAHDFYLKSPTYEYPFDLAERNFKKFANAFGVFSKEINAYRKQKGVDIKNPVDVADVVKYYNHLLQSTKNK